MQRDDSRAFHGTPQVAGAIELEIDTAGVIRDLSRRHRHRPQGNTGKLQVHQVTDLVRGADFYLQRQPGAQILGRQIGTRGEHELRVVKQCLVHDLCNTDSILALLEWDGNGVALQDDTQCGAQGLDHRLEGRAQGIVPIAREALRPARGSRESRQITGHFDQQPVQLLGMAVRL